MTWLVVLALLNPTMMRLPAAAAADLAAVIPTAVTICTGLGPETILIAEPAAETGRHDDQACSDCPSCVFPWGAALPPVPPAIALAALGPEPGWVEGNAVTARLWFLSGRPLRAPPRA